MVRFVRPWVLGLATVVVIVIVLLSASQLEEHDPFCIACHTTPEQTYFDRAQAASTGDVADLSSVHYVVSEDPFRCIDCHRGDDGLQDRATTLALGARDALTYFTGRADSTLEKGHTALPQLQNIACARCHAETLAEPGFNNHFHNELSTTQTSLTCTDCHRAHVQVAGGREVKFLDIEGIVYPACVTCHQQTGKGPLDLNN